MNISANISPNGTLNVKDNFHRQALAHWVQLTEKTSIPDIRHFRPQLFSRNMPRLAILEKRPESARYQLTLIGSRVAESFHFSSEKTYLDDLKDIEIQKALTDLANTAIDKPMPTVINKSVLPESFPAVHFSVLCMPFEHQSLHDKEAHKDSSEPSQMIVCAFSFSKSH